MDGIVTEHVVHAIQPLTPEITAIVPFSKDDVAALLAACEKTPEYTRPGKRASPVDNWRL
ncbi:MAG TPA: hypothetical protein PKZ84_10085 [Anaerolineae bacterium]|nr:hypothetical protein [Anaerolineae bacterium]HQI85017.1 hypothetical protein [Anaerolineae bacterium]